MAVFVCLCGPSSLPWNRDLFFLQHKPTSISQDNSGCVTSVRNVHLRGRSKHVALCVCFIQQLIQDGIIRAKQCHTTVQIPDFGTKALPRVPFESFTDQLVSDRHVGSKWFSFGPSYARVSAQEFKLLLLVPMVYVLCYPINVSYLLHYCLYLSLELFSKGGCAQFQGAWILRS